MILNHPEYKERIKKAADMPLWAPCVFAVYAMLMILPLIFASFPIFQKIEHIQNPENIKLVCKPDKKGNLVHFYDQGIERVMNESTLCNELRFYADYQVKDMILINYPMGYKPDLIKLEMIKASDFSDIDDDRYFYEVDWAEKIKTARQSFYRYFMIILLSMFLVMATMYWQKRNLALDLR